MSIGKFVMGIAALLALLSVALAVATDSFGESDELLPDEYDVMLYYRITSSDTVEVSSLHESERTREAIAIPSSVTIEGNAYAVTSIREGAFFEHGLRTVSIPDSISTIGAMAFENCANLASASIPDSVVTIGTRAFSGCVKLSHLKLPSGIDRIETGTFYGCASLESVTIPASVKEINSGAFSGCVSLTAMEGCEGVVHIKDSAFLNCRLLESIPFGEGLRSIGTGAFQKCASLSSVHLPESLDSIDESAFESCASLASISLPPNVTDIKNSTFKSCTSLYEAILNESITRIGISAFEGSGIAVIDIPRTVNSIGSGAFSNCPMLEEVSLRLSGLEVVSADMFLSSSSLTFVELPDTVRQIENGAFSGTALETIDLGDGLRSIGSKAFRDVPLGYISFPSSLNRVAADSFLGVPFCDEHGTEMDATASNLAGNSFATIDGKLMKGAFPVMYYIEGVRDGGIEYHRAGDVVALRDEPVRDGYVFTGWYTAEGKLEDAFEVNRFSSCIEGRWLKYSGEEDVVVEGGTATVSTDSSGAIIGPEAIGILKGSEKVAIDLNGSIISMDAGTFDSYAEGGEVVIVSKNVTDYGEDTDDPVLRDSKVYAFDIECQGRPSNSARIAYDVPYEAADPDEVRVYVKDGNGEYREIPAQYENGRLSFTHIAFGMFFVAEGEISDDSDQGAIAAIALVYAIATAGTIIARIRKKP